MCRSSVLLLRLVRFIWRTPGAALWLLPTDLPYQSFSFGSHWWSLRNFIFCSHASLRSGEGAGGRGTFQPVSSVWEFWYSWSSELVGTEKPKAVKSPLLACGEQNTFIRDWAFSADCSSAGWDLYEWQRHVTWTQPAPMLVLLFCMVLGVVTNINFLTCWFIVTEGLKLREQRDSLRRENPNLKRIQKMPCS